MSKYKKTQLLVHTSVVCHGDAESSRRLLAASEACALCAGVGGEDGKNKNTFQKNT